MNLKEMGSENKLQSLKKLRGEREARKPHQEREKRGESGGGWERNLCTSCREHWALCPECFSWRSVMQRTEGQEGLRVLLAGSQKNNSEAWLRKT